ncbi:hypothetical protein TNCV_3880931 [Trichonephila clavipes]|nr:hypothetical protein TNCV_3880931 [Trichonephila clavipes]
MKVTDGSCNFEPRCQVTMTTPELTSSSKLLHYGIVRTLIDLTCISLPIWWVLSGARTRTNDLITVRDHNYSATTAVPSGRNRLMG